MKWKSVLFSGLDGKLGDQIVGAKWKGRNYFRSYVIPANPQTNKQQCGRDEMANLVARCQSVVLSDADVKAAWNAKALPYLVSGFNLFCKQGRLSEISCPTPETGGTVTVTYTCGIPIQDAGMLSYNGSTWAIEVAKGSLEAGTDKTVDLSGLATNTYHFYIANLDVLKGADASPQEYQAVDNWKPNESTGVADAAVCAMTGA